MKIKDHFLTQEIFEIKQTKIKGVFKTTPIPANLSKYYESDNYISHHQDSNSPKEKLYKFLQGFNLDYKKKVVLESLGLHPASSPRSRNDPKILDFGCGAGEFLKFIENDFETFGYEPDLDARTATQKKLKQTKLVSSIGEIENNSLDAITLWHVFEHIENQDEVLENFYHKLKANGKLIIAVPNCTSYDAKHYQEYWAAYDVPRHILHFSKHGMENFIKQKSNHWNLKKIKPLLLDAFYIAMLSEKFQKKSLFWVKGLIFGTISNFKAIFSQEFSSLIYVLEKK